MKEPLNTPALKHNVQRLLNIEEAAVYLGRTPSGLRIMTHRGHIPVVRLDGRVQLDREDLDKLINSSKTRETVF